MNPRQRPLRYVLILFGRCLGGRLRWAEGVRDATQGHEKKSAQRRLQEGMERELTYKLGALWGGVEWGGAGFTLLGYKYKPPLGPRLAYFPMKRTHCER